MSNFIEVDGKVAANSFRNIRQLVQDKKPIKVIEGKAQLDESHPDYMYWINEN